MTSAYRPAAKSWGCLEAQPHPAVALVRAGVVLGRDRVGEDEEARLLAARGRQALEQQAVLVLQHREQPLARHVAAPLAVDRVAEGHVVGRDGLRDRAGGAADLQEPARHLLPGADLGQGSEAGRVQVDRESSLVRVERCGHGPARISARRADHSPFHALRRPRFRPCAYLVLVSAAQ
jgi:hypothetical protein